MPGICETTEYEACVYRHEFIERKGITMDKMKMDEMELGKMKLDQIKKYVLGTPIETDAAIYEVQAAALPCPYVEMDAQAMEISCPLGKHDIVYGLGQQVRGINKRGWKYTSFCSDDPNHTENKESLYAAHNFLVVAGQKPFGIFLDTPEKVSFDIGYSRPDRLSIRLCSWNANCYLIEGNSAYEIVRSFRKLIGPSYLPPKWAFGFGQSRWGYRNQQDIEEVLAGYEENNFPLDMIYLDIDYMDRYMDFTVDGEKFPDFPQFVEKMAHKGIHLVPIIDAGIKVQEGYGVYEEGVEKGYFCKDEEGRDFVGAVWPGRVHFPDMLQEEVRRWFGEKYKILLDQGIEGFWNDMNEPAIFYSEKHLGEVFCKLEDYKGKNLDIDSFFEMRDLVQGLSNYEEDYQSFYHRYQGESIRHDRVHNMYGYCMTRAASEAFGRLAPGKRILLFSRASYLGMHRYGGIWMGDNHSWWSHLLLSLKMLANLNMCGFLYTGPDLGGFGSDTTEDLLLRWYALGIFMPLMRNHSALGTRRQETYQFTDKESLRGILRLRYMLLPYLYSEYMKAALRDDLYAKPLAFVFPDDPHAERIEDQLLIGESVMIAPVYEQNARGRNVYLPEEMKLYRMRSPEDMEEETLAKGLHYVQAEVNEVLLFVRAGKLVPVAQAANRVAEVDMERLGLLGYVACEDAVYELYDDDGSSRDCSLEGHIRRITPIEAAETAAE